MRLAGKKALVTGGAGAIGSALSVGLAREGADVAVCYRHSEEKAGRLVKEITAMGRAAVSIHADVRKSADIIALIEKTVKALGGLDILINCHTAGPQIPVLELPEETLDEFLETNLRGYFIASQHAARQMVKQGRGGCIVNISSISSRSVTSSYVHYAATKGGIEATTRGMAVALGRHKIRVNCVAPGVVMTPTVASMFAEPANADPVNSRTPLGRVVTIEECVGPVIFFCSEESAGITGQVLDVDGGYSIQGMEWLLTDDIKNFRLSLEKTGYGKA
jgi:NAD(P)-dependent dehydrogenase (short-subunit alcohol dehydrogenase family)